MQKLPRIAPFSEAWTTGVVQVANREFGDHYFHAEGVRDMAADGAFYVALSGREVVGYCVFLHEPAAVTAGRMGLPPADLLPHAGRDGRVCCTKSMAVLAPYKGTGLAEALFARCLEDSEAAGMASAWGSAWKIGEKVPMDTIFRKHGFSVYTEIPLIWYRDKAYRCNICGGPCRCTGVIYSRYWENKEAIAAL